jgi:hypothetical protein
MKKKVYVFSFMILGLLLGFLAHGIIEMIYIRLLVNDYNRFGFQFEWSTWIAIHSYFTAILAVLGLVLGYGWGHKFWKILYVDKKYRKYFKKPLKQNF